MSERLQSISAVDQIAIQKQIREAVAGNPEEISLENYLAQKKIVRTLYELGVVDLFCQVASRLSNSYPDVVVFHTKPSKRNDPVELRMLWDIKRLKGPFVTADDITCAYYEGRGPEEKDSIQMSRGDHDFIMDKEAQNTLDLRIDHPELISIIDRTIASAIQLDKYAKWTHQFLMPRKMRRFIDNRIINKEDPRVQVFP